jgi:hypothetical protein
VQKFWFFFKKELLVLPGSPKKTAHGTIANIATGPSCAM